MKIHKGCHFFALAFLVSASPWAQAASAQAGAPASLRGGPASADFGQADSESSPDALDLLPDPLDFFEEPEDPRDEAGARIADVPKPRLSLATASKRVSGKTQRLEAPPPPADDYPDPLDLFDEPDVTEEVRRVQWTVARGAKRGSQGLVFILEEASRDGWRNFFLFGVVIFAIALCLVGGFLLVLMCNKSALGATIKDGIESYDEEILGTTVTLERLDVGMSSGQLDITNLVIENPTEARCGIKYKSEYLLKVGEAHAQLDMLDLTSNKVNIELLTIKDVHLIYEKSYFDSNYRATLNSSNVEFVINHLGKAAKDTPAFGKKSPTPDGNSSSGGNRSVSLHTVVIEDVSAQLAVTQFGAHGPKISVADFQYEDFEKEKGTYLLDDVVREVLRSVLTTALPHAKSLK